MDYRLFYTQRTLNDLAEIIGYIAEDDAEAAMRFGNSLLDHLDLLARFPRMGGTVRKRPQVRKTGAQPDLGLLRNPGTGTLHCGPSLPARVAEARKVLTSPVGVM